MGNWYEGDICEIHDTPDECREADYSCGMDETDDCDEGCLCPNTDRHDEIARNLDMMAEAYATGTIRL